jgi:hypothetical protein
MNTKRFVMLYKIREQLKLDDIEQVSFFRTFAVAETTTSSIDLEQELEKEIESSVISDVDDPEYNILFEIDHHNEENQLDSHELTEEDSDKIVDFLSEHFDLSSLSARFEEFFKDNKTEYNKRMDNLRSKLKQKLIYDHIRSFRSVYRWNVFHNLYASSTDYNNSIALSKIDDKNEFTMPVYFSVQGEAKGLYDHFNDGYGGPGSYDLSTTKINGNISNVTISKSDDITWKQIANNKTNNRNYNMYATGTVVETSSESWAYYPDPRVENDPGSYGSYNNEPVSGTLSYSTMDDKNNWNSTIHINNGIDELLEQCDISIKPMYYGVTCLHFYHCHRNHMRYRNYCNHLYHRHSWYKNEFDSISSLDEFFTNLKTIYESIGASFDFLKEKNIKLLNILKNDKNIYDFPLIFNVNNFIKDSISDDHQLGLFEYNGKIYEPKPCDKYFKSILEMTLPNISIQEIEDDYQLEIDESEELTFYTLYKESLEDKNEDLFNLLFNSLLTSDTTQIYSILFTLGDTGKRIKKSEFGSIPITRHGFCSFARYYWHRPFGCHIIDCRDSNRIMIVPTKEGDLYTSDTIMYYNEEEDSESFGEHLSSIYKTYQLKIERTDGLN